MTVPTLRPETEAALAGMIAEAAAAGCRLAVRGQGSKTAMLRPVAADARLTTTALSGVVFHAPSELVLSARSGTPLAEIEATLAAAGQHLIAEPPELGGLLARATGQAAAPATLGGTVAANLSGPRRVAWGAMRDHVVGLRAVNGKGEVIRSGGRVLKNVTGLDLCKLLSGSHGTLAVISEITLKVLPAPEATATLVLPGLGPKEGVRALAAALGSPFGVSGAAWLPDACAGRPGALVRLEDFAASVAYRGDKLRALLAVPGTRVIEGEESRARWRAIGNAEALPVVEGAAVWRVSVRPSKGPSVLAATVAAGGQAFLDWGGGLVWATGPATPALHQAITAAAARAGGVWMLLAAPEELRVEVAVVPPEPAPLARLTRRVKSAFDPRGILNPGRIFADC